MASGPFALGIIHVDEVARFKWQETGLIPIEKLERLD
jgi:hypothetical protein